MIARPVGIVVSDRSSHAGSDPAAICILRPAPGRGGFAQSVHRSLITVKAGKEKNTGDAAPGETGEPGATPAPLILIVDPDRFRREGMSAILRKRWPPVTCGFASGYGSAIDQLGSGKWDLVLIELNIPGRGGLDLLAKIVNDWNIPALLVSGEPEAIYGMRALRSGSAGYLQRNLPPEEIAEAVAAVLAGGRYVSEQLASRLDPNGSPPAIPFASLSDREFQVLRAIASGQCIKEIASSLSLSAKTVSTYRARILMKLHSKTDADLVRYCLEHRLVGAASEPGPEGRL